MDEYSRVKSEQISARPFNRAQWGDGTLHYNELIESQHQYPLDCK
ncbi:MAG: hypothetical protein VX709_05720 [Pseudomonadota bacterium]|nr:hypothetical protein [Pseudomonadota bacterium]